MPITIFLKAKRVSLTCKPLTNLYIHYLEANKINHFYVICSNYIARALKQPNLTLYFCCQLPFPYIPLELLFTFQGKKKKKKTQKEKRKFHSLKKTDLKILLLCNIVHSIKKLSGEGCGHRRTQHNHKQ